MGGGIDVATTGQPKSSPLEQGLVKRLWWVVARHSCCMQGKWWGMPAHATITTKLPNSPIRQVDIDGREYGREAIMQNGATYNKGWRMVYRSCPEKVYSRKSRKK